MIEKAIAFSAPEWEALGGLPFMQRCLYLVLRWYMDRHTGRVGDSRGISLQGLAEELYVEPVRGRHASECGSPTKKAVRSALDGLERAGLIQPCGNGEVLVFFLGKARRAVARPKDEGHMRGTQEGRDEGHRQTKDLQGFGADEGHDEGHGQNPDEGHTSSTRVNNPSKQPSSPASRESVDKSALLLMPLRAEAVAEWIRLQEAERGCKARVTGRAPLIAAWLELAVTGEELHEAYSLAKRNRDSTQNPSAIWLPYLDVFVKRVVAERRVSSGEGAAGPTSSDWWGSEAGIIAKAKALGVERIEGEDVQLLRSRVIDAIEAAMAAGGKKRGGAYAEG